MIPATAVVKPNVSIAQVPTLPPARSARSGYLRKKFNKSKLKGASHYTDHPYSDRSYVARRFKDTDYLFYQCIITQHFTHATDPISESDTYVSASA